jgi:predicted RNase H-like HicB family nuclease
MKKNSNSLCGQLSGNIFISYQKYFVRIDSKSFSEGNTKKEALKNIREPILLYLEPVEEDLNYSSAS